MRIRPWEMSRTFVLAQLVGGKLKLTPNKNKNVSVWLDTIFFLHIGATCKWRDFFKTLSNVKNSLWIQHTHEDFFPDAACFVFY